MGVSNGNYWLVFNAKTGGATQEILLYERISALTTIFFEGVPNLHLGELVSLLTKPLPITTTSEPPVDDPELGKIALMLYGTKNVEPVFPISSLVVVHE